MPVDGGHRIAGSLALHRDGAALPGCDLPVLGHHPYRRRYCKIFRAKWATISTKSYVLKVHELTQNLQRVHLVPAFVVADLADVIAGVLDFHVRYLQVVALDQLEAGVPRDHQVGRRQDRCPPAPQQHVGSWKDEKHIFVM